MFSVVDVLVSLAAIIISIDVIVKAFNESPVAVKAVETDAVAVVTDVKNDAETAVTDVTQEVEKL